jgi:hypothetical protein
MSARDQTELEAARVSLTRTEYALLGRLNIPAEVKGDAGALQIALSHGNRIFEPVAEGGHRAFIWPIRVGHVLDPQDAEPETVAARGHLIDLLALHPAAPDHWALRRGRATWAGAMPLQTLAPEPVQIARNPWSWLRGGRRKLLIVTTKPREAQSLLLYARHEIVAEDDEHQRELEELVNLPFPAPRVSVDAAERGQAA